MLHHKSGLHRGPKAFCVRLKENVMSLGQNHMQHKKYVSNLTTT